jgi:adenosylcobinamide-GDP ribazoletransferase
MLSIRANAISSFSNGFDAFVICAAAAALSRTSMVFLMVATPYARQDGLAAMAGKPSMNAALSSLWISVIPLLFLIKLNIVLPCVVALVIACGVIKHLASRHFGGITGDVLGATQQISEAVILIILSSNLPL